MQFSGSEYVHRAVPPPHHLTPSHSRTSLSTPQNHGTLSRHSLSLPQPLTTRNPLSVSVDWPVLDVSHQWNHTLCVLLRLASLTEHRVSGSIHVAASVSASLLFMAERCARVWRDHIWCICHPLMGARVVSAFGVL